MRDVWAFHASNVCLFLLRNKKSICLSNFVFMTKPCITNYVNHAQCGEMERWRSHGELNCP